MSYLYSFIAVSVAGAELTNEEASLLSNNHAICAVVLFTRNIINPSQLTYLVKQIRVIREDMIIMVDNEGLDQNITYNTRSGVWRMLDTQGQHNTAFPTPPPSQYTISQIFQESPEKGLDAAYKSGKALGELLTMLKVMPLGVVLCSNPGNLAPYPNPKRTAIQTVIDDTPGLNTNETKVPVIPQKIEISQRLSTASPEALQKGWIIRGLGRSFGEDPLEQIYPLAQAKLQGLKAAGVVTNVKHAVDHGWSDADSHVEKSIDTRTEAALFEHLEVYKKLSEDKLLDSIMTSHVVYSESQDPINEFGLSAYWLNVLREQVGPEPVFMSDCLSMGAIKESSAIRKKEHTEDFEVNYLVEAICCASNPMKYDKEAFISEDTGTHTDVVLVCNRPAAMIDRVLSFLTFKPDESVKNRLMRLHEWAKSLDKSTVFSP